MASALQGVAELEAKLAQLASPSKNTQVLRASLNESMQGVRAVARSRAPVGSKRHKTYKGNVVSPGFAKKSLRVETTAKNGAVTAKLGVLKEAFYALQFIELGTATIPRAPWMVPAFESQQDQALRKIGESMRKRIDRIAAQRMARGR